MPSKRLTRIQGWITANNVAFIGEPELEALKTALPDIPEPALRKLLRNTSTPLAPMIEGVRQDTFENLARTLIALQHLYESAPPAQRQAIRNLVITAKDHARLASRHTPEKHEMLVWLLLWLENPPIFESWHGLRARV